ncbi:MAG TPA: hypothetical protein VGR16_14345, partial [Thermomicrobiales bacterium]|nr:hypothetical protein [Thermomicrobiales bacterium]
LQLHHRLGEHAPPSRVAALVNDPFPIYTRPETLPAGYDDALKRRLLAELDEHTTRTSRKRSAIISDGGEAGL